LRETWIACSEARDFLGSAPAGRRPGRLPPLLFRAAIASLPHGEVPACSTPLIFIAFRIRVVKKQLRHGAMLLAEEEVDAISGTGCRFRRSVATSLFRR
jgi:hypothetical protein